MIDFVEMEKALLEALPAIATACAIALGILLIWLILRPLRTWYWKVDKRNEELADLSKEICDLNAQVKDLKGELRMLQEVKYALRENRQAPDTVKTDYAPAQEAPVPEKKVSAESAPAEDDLIETFRRPEPERAGYDTDRSGRKYTMEEIDLQIKD